VNAVDPALEPMAAPVSSASAWNIANALTVFRLVLVPVFVAALFRDGGHTHGWRWAAFGVFALASYTDRIDGQLARSRNLVTAFGKASSRPAGVASSRPCCRGWLSASTCCP
jgi:CDP-diacylglycerol--glycerol-3-phosphate 3-phosphatidyltransferase